MDRSHGRFRKGRQGHPRNVNSYLIAQQKMKRWRYPFIAMGVFFLFLFSFEVTGDLLQTNVLADLSESLPASVTEENFSFVQKSLLGIVKEEVRDCQEAKLSECVSEGKSLAHALLKVETPDALEKLFSRVEDFGIAWSDRVDTALCEKDISKALGNLEQALGQLQSAVDRHGQSVQNMGQADDALHALTADLASFKVPSLCR